MGRQQQHKGGNTKAPAKKRQAAPELDDDMYDEVEQHHKAKQHEDFIALGGNGEEEEESEEDEEGVFDLDVDTESSSGDDDDDDDEEEEEDEDEDEEEDSDVEPPKQQRRQASLSVERAGLLSDEEEEDEDEDEDEAAGARKVRQWGKHKQQYYNADATDLEIGQDFGDAEEEEAAAREVEQARYDEMDEEDYVDGLGGSDDGEEEEEETLSARVKKQAKEGKEGKKAKAKAALAPLLGDLSLLQGGVDERGDVETARVRKDLSKLSKAGKLQVLITDSPELLTLLEEFKEKLGELRDRVEPLVPLARQGGIGPARLTEEGVAYLEVKQQLLLNYCLNLTYYLLLKAEGRAVKDHPVIGQLLELRAALERMRPLDAKLKYQLDRLLQLAAAAPVEAEGGVGNGQKDPLSFRPNPGALVGKTGGGGDLEEDEEEEEGEEGEGGESRGGVYRPPRMAAVPYEEGEGAEGGRKKKGKEEAAARKNLEKLRRSELLQTLTEQFSDKPELVAERGNLRTAAQQKVEDAEEERRRFEEDRFIRLVTSKKDKKARKAADQQATRLETIADIGDFHELQASLTALQSSNSSNGRPVVAVEAEAAPREKKGLSALQKAVNSIAQKEQTKKRRREAELEGDVDVPYRKRDETIRVRRPAPSAEDEEEGFFGGDDDGASSGKKKKGGKAEQARHSDADEYLGAMASMEDDPLYEEVAASKAKRKAEKAALYAVEPRYGAMEDELVAGALGEGEKRGINHQILKNRGLTAYKSKLNRNPRVKKREAYRKAVIKRKGQVRDVRASEAGSYGGETTGINAKVVRVRGKK